MKSPFGRMTVVCCVVILTLKQLFGKHAPFDDTHFAQQQHRGDIVSRPSPKPPIQRRVCRRSELVKGKWVPRQYSQLPYLPKQIERKQCYSSLVSPWDTYDWQPLADCLLEDFSAPEFCRLAQNKTVAFLGDSLTMEHFSALVHTMGVTTFDEESTFQEGGPKSFEFEVCGGQTRLYFRRSNWIRAGELNSTLHAGDPDILIMNKGAWYSIDDGLVARIQQYIEILQRWKRPIHFIWRTTVPGHPECGRFHEPATSIQAMEQHVTDRSMYTEHTLRWHWYDFQKQNQIVVGAFSNSSLDWDLLDAYALNILRPDEHQNGDCLHNCQPGSKTLVLDRILLHLMKLRAEQGVES